MQKKKAAIPAPVDKIRTFSVRLRSSVRRKLKERAEQSGLSLQDMVDAALRAYLAETTREKREALSPFGSLDQEEQRNLSCLLVLMRSGSENSDLQAIVKAVCQRWRRTQQAAAVA